MSECVIALDVSDYSIVIVCTCGWRSITDTKASAWALGAQHQKRQGQHRGNAISTHFKRVERGAQHGRL